MSTVTDFHLAWYFCLPRIIRPRPFHTLLAFPASLQSDWQAIINPWQEQTTLKAVWCTSRWLYRPKTQFDSVWADLWWPRCLQPLNAWHRQLPGAVKLFEFVTCANSSLLAPKIIDDFFLSGDSTGRHSATVRSHFTTEHSGRVGPAHFMFIPQGANNTMFLFSISPAYRCLLFDRYDGRTASTLGSTRVLWICVLPVCVCARACVRECVRAWFRGAMVAACADVRHHVRPSHNHHSVVVPAYTRWPAADVCQPCLRQTYQRLLASSNSQPVLWGVDHLATRLHWCRCSVGLHLQCTFIKLMFVARVRPFRRGCRRGCRYRQS